MLYHLSYWPMKSPTYEEEKQKQVTPEFIEERRYLKNVSSQTLQWYQRSFKAFADAPEPERQSNRGLWNCETEAYPPRVSTRGYDASRLKEEQKVLATLNPDHVKRQVAFRPKGLDLWWQTMPGLRTMA